MEARLIRFAALAGLDSLSGRWALRLAGLVAALSGDSQC